MVQLLLVLTVPSKGYDVDNNDDDDETVATIQTYTGNSHFKKPWLQQTTRTVPSAPHPPRSQIPEVSQGIGAIGAERQSSGTGMTSLLHRAVSSRPWAPSLSPPRGDLGKLTTYTACPTLGRVLVRAPSANRRTLSYLVGALSPVNHWRLYQGRGRLS